MAKTKLTVVRPVQEGGEDHQVIVRPERNIDRLPAIWAPSNGRVTAKVKTIDFDVDLNGKSVRAQLVILPAIMYVKPPKKNKKKGQYAGKKKEVRATLTTFDQRVFLVLIKIWEEDEKKDGDIYFSMREIARELGLDWGSETIRLIEESLYRLKLVTLDWQKSFITKNGKTIEIASLDPTNILAELKIVKRKEDGKVVKEKGYFRFHSSIENNLKATYTRPVRLDVVCSFASHVAQLIYTLIDREIYGDAAKVFQMRSENLFRVLGLTGERYRYKSRRVEVLDPALKELTGKPLSSGEVITSAELKETADKKDFNAIIKKGSHKLALCAGPDNPQPPERTLEDSILIQKLMDYGIDERRAAGLVEKDRDECALWADAWPHQNQKGMDNPPAVLISFIEINRRPLPKAYAETIERERQKKENEAARRRELAEELHCQYFAPIFLDHSKEELSKIAHTFPDAYRVFEEHFDRKHAKDLRRIESEEVRKEFKVRKAMEFFNEIRPELGVRLTTFDEWNETENRDNSDPIQWFTSNPEAANKLLG
jgi:hypothetical protein